MKSLFNKLFGNKLLTKNYLLFLLTVILFSSCSSLRTIPVEISFLPSEKLPDRLQSFTLVNRAVNNRFENHRADSLQQYFFQRQFNMDTVILDTQSADTLLFALSNMLFESGRYDVVIPENRFLNSGSGSFAPAAMPWREVDTLVKTFNTDAVLSLDYFRTRVITDYKRETLYDQSSGNFFTGYFADMQVAYESLYRIYDPGMKEFIRNIAITDTLFWSDADYEIRPLFNRFTTVKGALVETAIHSAMRLSEKIAPVWRMANRKYFYKGNALLEQAHQLVLADDWNGAANLWEQLATTTNSKALRSKAEFNLAVAYEMFGNMDEAISWGLKSYDSKFRQVTYNYLDVLNTRKKQLGMK